jgi:hypothetical protein
MARKGKNRRKPSPRKIAEQNGYKSGFEFMTAQQLDEKKIHFEYELRKIRYIVPSVEREYTPDFFLDNGIIIETKGRFTLEDRKKHILIRRQHPNLDIRLVFQSPYTKIRKGSKTTYAAWATKVGITWANKEIPDSWLNE